MRGTVVRQAREARGWTQHEGARRLGVSQGYLSLLETGRRPVPRRLVRKLQKHFGLPASALPVEDRVPPLTGRQLAEQLAGLGYPPFAYLRAQLRMNPAQVVLAALRASVTETRLVEALPWVVLHYPGLPWDWLLDWSKVHDVQNRLGFVVTLARELAERAGDEATRHQLRAVETRLERSRLVREDTLSQETMTNAERRWLREHRPVEAQHWNVLTDLTVDQLPYAA